MLPEPPARPLRYRPDLETPAADEDKAGDGLRQQVLNIAETTYRHGGHAVRGVHASSHGLLNAELVVLPDLPVVLRQGMFETERRYPAIMRFSTTPGDILPDSVATPRGLAIKAFGVEGDRLPGAGGSTQDFVLVNGKAFATPDARAFLARLRGVGRPGDKGVGLRRAVSAALGGAQPQTHILGESFFSQVPIRFGEFVAKVGVFPVSEELMELTDQPPTLDGRPSGLRESIVDFFGRHGGVWELRVQLCTDLDAMPIEDAATVWPEDRSPYVPVARIVAPKQSAWSTARAEVADDTLSFSPWHGLEAHRPLGSIMRLRKAVYEAAANFRAEHNHVLAEEPRSFRPLADL